MAETLFDPPRPCPMCKYELDRAEQKKEFEPVIVVVCPSCSALLWRAGYESDSPLVPFDPYQDEGGI